MTYPIPKVNPMFNSPKTKVNKPLQKMTISMEAINGLRNNSETDHTLNLKSQTQLLNCLIPEAILGNQIDHNRKRDVVSKTP